MYENLEGFQNLQGLKLKVFTIYYTMIEKKSEEASHSFSFPRSGIGIKKILFIVLIIILVYHTFVSKRISYAFYVSGKISIVDAPPFEIYPGAKIPNPGECVPYTEPCIPYHKPIPKAEKPILLPKVAIIIDDIGYDRKTAAKLLSLNVALTFSVLPQSPFGKGIVKKAREKGIEIMLHLPLEPLEYPSVKPGPGAIYTEMTPDRLISQLNQNLEEFPFVVGVNNHMGSRITSNSSQMYQIHSVLKKKELFFVDSFTNIDSLCGSTARLLNIPFAKRDVFLDHTQEASP